MRRLVVIAALGLTACSTPPIVLAPAFPVGTQRVYALSINATTDIDVPGAASVETRVLEARSTLDIVGQTADGARVILTVEPTRALVNGIAEDRPTQVIEMILAADGTVAEILTVDGAPADAAGGVEELAPMVGIPLPEQRVHLGDRWRVRLPNAEGEQTGRITGLRSVDGYDSVVVALGTTRQIRRERAIESRSLALIGTEFSASTLTFALAEAFPVHLRTRTEGRFQIEGAGPSAGSVLVRSDSTLRLLEVGTRASS